MNQNRVMVPFACALLLLGARSLRAQQDPSLREIQELARRVDEQLREIDRLLLESSKPNGEGGQKPPQLLQQSRQQSEVVEQSIDDLIQKLTEMKNRSQSGSSGEDSGQPNPQQGQPQNGRQQGQNRPRQENQGQDFVDQSQQGQQQEGQQQEGQQQEGQQHGQQDKQPQHGKQPGDEANPQGGENRPATQLPENETGPGQRGTGEDEWGKLQRYVNQLKNRGSPPKVPEKYRKYWEAYLKSKGSTR